MFDGVRSPGNRETIGRRAVLRLSAGLAILSGTGLLAACSAGAPATPSAPQSAPASANTSAGAQSSGAASGTAKLADLLPKYIPNPQAPKADLPSTGPGIDDAWTNFPKQAFKSVTDTPGRGGDVNVVSGSAWPPYTPADQNPMLQELNKRLNVNLKLDITTLTDYNTKFNTLVAGSNLPDVFWVGQTPNLVDFLKQQCADLTPFLAGDAVKDYPNLANLNTNTWKGTVFGGAIMGLPSPLGAMGNIIQMNKTRWDAEIGANVRPKNADDLKKMMQQLTNPQANKYAIASGATDPYGVLNGWFAMMYGAPNNWGMVGDKLVNFRETDAFKQSIGYLRDLVQLGVFHPKSATYDSVAAKRDHATGQFVLIQGTFYGNHVDMWNRGAAANPKVDFTLLEPIAADGGKPINWLSSYIWPKNYLGPGIWAFRKASNERIQELLRVWNWICGPFGSEERLLWEYGVEGTDYTRDANGNIVQTQRGPADSTFVPLRFGPHSPDMLYNPPTPEYGPAMQKLEQVMVPEGVLDPTLGLYSPTAGSKGAPLDNAFSGVMTDIVAGRRPLGDVDQAVKDWQSNGGDQMRTEYMQGLAAA
jgi:putative aldouronate transport system substrate-binding protein